MQAEKSRSLCTCDCGSVQTLSAPQTQSIWLSKRQSCTTEWVLRIGNQNGCKRPQPSRMQGAMASF
eukprot:5666055-Amphidinium_carterae.1